MKYYLTTIKGKKKLVGELVGDLFYKRVNFTEHHFHKAKAWGIDLEVFKKLRSEGCERIMFLDDESGNKWISELSIFERKHWVHEYPGFQAQAFLADHEWEIRKGDGTIIQASASKEPIPVKQIEKVELVSPQLKLW